MTIGDFVYSEGLNTEHWNTQHFEVWISNCLALEWSVTAKAIARVPTIKKPNHCKSRKNSSHFALISGFGQNGHHFVQNGTPLENHIEGYHWNSERLWYSSPHCIPPGNECLGIKL